MMNDVNWTKVDYDECASLIRNTQAGVEKVITLSIALNSVLAVAVGALWRHAAQLPYGAQLPHHILMIAAALTGALINHRFVLVTKKVEDTLAVCFSRLCEIERGINNLPATASSAIRATIYHRLKDIEDRWRPRRPELPYLALLLVWLLLAGYVVLGRWVFNPGTLLPVADAGSGWTKWILAGV